MRLCRSFNIAPSFFISVILCFGACKDIGTEPFSGITETRDDPTPIGNVDPDDWRSLSIVGAFVYPAYPNPTTSSCILRFKLQERDSILISLNELPNGVIKLIASKSFSPGDWSVRIDVADIDPKIYRLFFSIVRTSNTFTTYGDIKVQR